MKLVNKLQFGFKPVQAGQKVTAVNTLPQLIVNSTKGKFTLTGTASKAMNIAVGEYIMFFHNIDIIEEKIQGAILGTDDTMINIASELGVDINTSEGKDAIIAACTQWGIAKGVAKYTEKDERVMSTLRFTKEDRERYLESHRMEIVEENRAELIETFGEMSDEELAEKLTIDMVQSPKVPAFEGSKTSTTSNATGIGCILGFTDSSIWNELKKDLGDIKTKKNRIFDIELDNPTIVNYRSGSRTFDVKVYPIVFKEDTDTMVRGEAQND